MYCNNWLRGTWKNIRQDRITDPAFLFLLKPRTAQVPPELPAGGRKRRSAQDMIFYFFAVRTHIQQ